MFRLIFILPNIRLYFLDNIGFFTIDKASSRLGKSAVTSMVQLNMVADNGMGQIANSASLPAESHIHKIAPFRAVRRIHKIDSLASLASLAFAQIEVAFVRHSD